ncbi:enoyl-CoA hydratase [Methylosinus sporium]|uniref:Enoyl-CoA hydratase n=1 Tax=Methylosinus sporium TaxID=428 RepID=A0A549SXY6_METSR|nr:MULTISPECIES: enoyl-CoA hydratase-related protein [Methylosinus]MBU3889808.1 enoyl-CoA hydratase/isomerase family protein [Methylosinus sp. KRF6]TRL34484.1 enoyl-CoA hydratase [Methylosinus sporium]
MQNRELIVSRDGPLMRIVIDRPAKRNALSRPMYEAMIAAFAKADADEEIRAIVLSSAGGDFTAGNDLEDFRRPLDNVQEFSALRFVRALAALQTPIVAAVVGDAIGVGVTMLFHCDLVYASHGARFKMPFVDLGVIPEAASTLLVPQRIGHVKATEFMLLCESFGASEALRLGVVNAIAGFDEVEEMALDAARRLAAKPRAALAATRRLLRGDAATIAARIEEEAALFAAALTTRETRARLEAFFAGVKDGEL